MEDDFLDDDNLLHYFLSGDEAAVGGERHHGGRAAETTGLSPRLDDLGVGQAFGLDIDGIGVEASADGAARGGISPVVGADDLPGPAHADAVAATTGGPLGAPQPSHMAPGMISAPPQPTTEGSAAHRVGAAPAGRPAGLGARTGSGGGMAASRSPAGPRRSASHSSMASAPPEEGGAEAAEGSEERRKRRLARNRESARQSRRRKKEQLEKLEERLVELSREVAQLRAKRLAEGSKRLMRLRSGAVAQMSHWAAGADGGDAQSRAELQAALDDYSRLYGPDSEERRSIRDYYRQQVEAVVLPPYAQFLLWTMQHADTFLKIQSGQMAEPEEAGGAGPSPGEAGAARLWRQVREELTLTTEQEHKLLSQLRTHENATGAEERHRLLGALNLLQGLHEALQRSASAIQNHADQLRSILTPSQYARYLGWVNQNRGRLRACQDSVAASAARGMGAAAAGPRGVNEGQGHAASAPGHDAQPQGPQHPGPGAGHAGATARAGAGEDGHRAALHQAQKVLQSADEEVSGRDVASVLPLLRR